MWLNRHGPFLVLLQNHTERAFNGRAQTLTDKVKGPALRHEALTLMDQLPREFGKLHSMTRWKQLMRQ